MAQVARCPRCAGGLGIDMTVDGPEVFCVACAYRPPSELEAAQTKRYLEATSPKRKSRQAGRHQNAQQRSA